MPLIESELKQVLACLDAYGIPSVPLLDRPAIAIGGDATTAYPNDINVNASAHLGALCRQTESFKGIQKECARGQSLSSRLRG
jgi:hypothetical protein